MSDLRLEVEDVSLTRARRDDITLGDAIAAAAVDGAVALGWSARAVSFGRLDGGQVTGPDRAPLATDEWFEARVFDAGAELRWLRRHGPRGLAVCVSEQPKRIPDGWDALPSKVLGKITGGQALLWGRARGRGATEGWTSLTAARIGSIETPIAAPVGASVVITSVEYLGTDPHGNAITVDERLTGLAVLDQKDR